MKDDPLRDAIVALREEADASEARPSETRARVMRTLAARRARRHRAIRVLVPMAAVFLGSVAWASATHRLPETWYQFVAEIGLASNETTEQPSAPPTARTSATGTKSEPVADRVAEPNTESIVQTATATNTQADIATNTLPDIETNTLPDTAPRIEPSVEPKNNAAAIPEKNRAVSSAAVATPTPTSSASEAAPSSASSSPEDGLELYRAAHRAHFGGQSPSAALAAWDAYLAAAPRGRFATEAHYNRALCLVRLGRISAARQALEPFARGAFGGYRQKEAQSLLDAIDGANAEKNATPSHDASNE